MENKETNQEEMKIEEQKHKRALKIGAISAAIIIILIALMSYFIMNRNGHFALLECPIAGGADIHYADCPIPAKKNLLAAVEAAFGWNPEDNTSTQSPSDIGDGSSIAMGSGIGGGSIDASCPDLVVFPRKVHSTTGIDSVSYVYYSYCNRGIAVSGDINNIGTSTTRLLNTGGSIGGGNTATSTPLIGGGVIGGGNTASSTLLTTGPGIGGGFIGVKTSIPSGGFI